MVRQLVLYVGRDDRIHLESIEAGSFRVLFVERIHVLHEARKLARSSNLFVRLLAGPIDGETKDRDHGPGDRQNS